MSVYFPGNTVPAGTMLSASNGPAPIPGLPSLSSRSKSFGSAVHTLAAAPTSVLDFVGPLVFSTSFSLSVLPEITFTVAPPPSANEEYFLALYTPTTGWTLAADGPAILSGSTLTFLPQILSTPLAIQANTPYAVALYTEPGTSPTPQPTQSPTVTASSFSFEPLPLLGGTTFSLVQNGAFGGTLTLPAVVAGSDCNLAIPTVSGFYGTSPPAGSPLFANQGGTDFYVQITFSCTVLIVGPASATFIAPSGSVGIDYAVGSGGTYADAGLSITPIGSSPGGYTEISVSTTPPSFTALIPGGTTYTLVLFPTSAPE